MKKILMFVLLFVPFTVVADTMCVRDRTLVISLYPKMYLKNGILSSDDSLIYGDFPDGRILVEYTKLSDEEGLGRTVGEGEFYGVGDYAEVFITAEKGLNGVDANGKERKYCWYRLVHPVSSPWVFGAAATDCATWGTRWGLHERLEFQKGLFKSVGL